MRKLITIFTPLILLFFINSLVFSQFVTEEYKQFLEQNKNLNSERLFNLYSAGLFEKSINPPINAEFYDSVLIKYEITADEQDLISKNGFVVSQRLAKGSFGHQFEDIFHKDLPVFISSDAILHAFHASYDKILKNTELAVLINKLDELLTTLKSNFPALKSKVSTQANLDLMMKDLDVYLTVAQRLLTGYSNSFFPENDLIVDELIGYVDAEEFQEIALFSETKRKVDFSQFKPRGHYDDEYHPELANYFRTMMWFGRIELYLIAPHSLVKVPIEDVQRQIIISALFSELIALSNSRHIFNEIEFIIETFVGEQDNVTLPGLEEVLTESGVTSIDLLLDTSKVRNFQNVLKTKSYAGQQILSQILIHDPFSPDKIEPASAFMPFGQRFVIDSYVTGSVVYDRVMKPGKPKRMLPSTLDILFALGNDASAQLLKDELDSYDYSSNLAALRYLIDSYDEVFWEKSIYNLWLNSIRQLNPNEDRSNLPEFMQTAAWWQQKMNSQLASWTELRHDNLLYAKQSYTGGTTCSYPQSYVEPVPHFFNSISKLSKLTLNKLSTISAFDNWTIESFTKYFNNLTNVADTLEIIAQKELDYIPLTQDEKDFLKRMLYDNPQHMCGTPAHLGWYPNLYYNDFEQTDFHKEDYLVADYHTAPTDASGNFVGWVKHAGTGPIDLAIIITKNSENKNIAFVGPVSSYYEYTSTNFYRLTDDEWKETYLFNNGVRPDWTKIYLASKDGKIQQGGIQLLTNIQNTNNNINIDNNYILAQNYPNPFNPSTIISYSIPANLANKRTKLRIYNIHGELIRELVNENLPAGNYLSRWNGKNNSGLPVSSGVYFYEISSESHRFVGKMNLMK